MIKKIRAAFVVLAVAAALLVGLATPAQATQYFNCPNGVACLWEHSNGGGQRLVISVGSYGYNICWPMNSAHFMYHKASSGSADFGGGWDLKITSTSSCSSTFNYQIIQSSNFENWGGQPFNDWSTSFVITQF